MIKEYIAYLKNNPEGYWFKRKQYGWGWVPATWQGWLVLGVYILVVFGLTTTIDSANPNTMGLYSFVIPVFVLTALLVFICFKKGEKPQWRWKK